MLLHGEGGERGGAEQRGMIYRRIRLLWRIALKATVITYCFFSAKAIMQIVYRTRSRKPARVNAKIPPSDGPSVRSSVRPPADRWQCCQVGDFIARFSKTGEFWTPSG